MIRRHIPQHARPGRRTLYVLLIVLGLGAAGVGGVELGENLTGRHQTADPPAAALLGQHPSAAASDESAETSATVPASAPPTSSGTPVRIRIPAIGVDAFVQKLYLTTTGTLSVPTQTNQAGWYTGSSVPGDPGPAVIAGHLDSTSGPAVFIGLDRLRPGDGITIELSTGKTVAYTVTGTQTTLKTQFPTTTVYGPTPDAELRLVTCTGDLVDGSYLDNLIVFAQAA